MATTINPRRRASDAAPQHHACAALKPARGAVKKGATFHSSPSLSPPGLLPSQTDLGDVVDARIRRALLIVTEVDRSLSTTPDDLADMLKNSSLVDLGSPVPRSLLDLSIPGPVATASANRALDETPTSATATSSSFVSASHLGANSVPRSFRTRQSRNQDKAHRVYDSGLGSSIASSSVAKSKSRTSVAGAQSVSAVSMSAAASSTLALDQVRGLSSRSINRIHEHTLRPLRADSTFKVFEPILIDVPRRIRAKEIICLRDVEKTLLFMAPVSTNSHLLCGQQAGDAHRPLLHLKETSKDNPALCLDFCRASVRCIQATVEYLSDHEQTRPTDRPYTNGYFLDLEEQLKKYALQLSEASKISPTALSPTDKDEQPSGNYQLSAELDRYVFSHYTLLYHQPALPAPSLRTVNGQGGIQKEMRLLTEVGREKRSDEVKLFGGVAKNGRPAELVRVKKDGRAFSLATGRRLTSIMTRRRWFGSSAPSAKRPRMKRRYSGRWPGGKRALYLRRP